MQQFSIESLVDGLRVAIGVIVECLTVVVAMPFDLDYSSFDKPLSQIIVESVLKGISIQIVLIDSSIHRNYS